MQVFGASFSKAEMSALWVSWSRTHRPYIQLRVESCSEEVKGALGKVKCTLRQIWSVAISNKLGQVGLLGEVPRSRLWKGAWELAWWTPTRTFHSEEMVVGSGQWPVGVLEEQEDRYRCNQ